MTDIFENIINTVLLFKKITINFSYSSEYEVVSHCGFNLYFPGD